MHFTAQLGLFLFTAMGMKHLCMIFGITPSTWSEIINNLLTKLVHKLIRHPLARVQFPNAERMEYFARMIHQCEPEVDDVIGFMDGCCCVDEMLDVFPMTAS